MLSKLSLSYTDPKDYHEHPQPTVETEFKGAQAHMSSRDDLKWSVKSVRLIEELEMLLQSPSQNHSHSEGKFPTSDRKCKNDCGYGFVESKTVYIMELNLNKVSAVVSGCSVSICDVYTNTNILVSLHVYRIRKFYIC